MEASAKGKQERPSLPPDDDDSEQEEEEYLGTKMGLKAILPNFLHKVSMLGGLHRHGSSQHRRGRVSTLDGCTGAAASTGEAGHAVPFALIFPVEHVRSMMSGRFAEQQSERATESRLSACLGKRCSQACR